MFSVNWIAGFQKDAFLRNILTHFVAYTRIHNLSLKDTDISRKPWSCAVWVKHTAIVYRRFYLVFSMDRLFA